MMRLIEDTHFYDLFSREYAQLTLIIISPKYIVIVLIYYERGVLVALGLRYTPLPWVCILLLVYMRYYRGCKLWDQSVFGIQNSIRIYFQETFEALGFKKKT